MEFPSTEGQLGVQRGHMPLTVLLTRGQIRFREGEGIRKAGVEKGLSLIHIFFDILRRFDETDVDVIYSESFETPNLGQAIMNRLLKAAGHRMIKV